MKFGTEMKYGITAFLLIVLLPFAVQSKPDVKLKNKKKSSKTDSFYKKEKESETKSDFEFCFSVTGDMYFFYIKSNIDDEEQSLDFSDAKYKMEYQFDPVYLVSFQTYARWNFLKIDADYKTDRILNGGGSVEQSDEVATKLTKNKTVSDVLELGINLFDLYTSYRSVQFDCGQATVLDAKTNKKVSTGQIKLNVTDIDILYDFYPGGRRYPLKISAGYKYMRYSLPRIVYCFNDTISGENDNWEYGGETVPQEVMTTSHMGGLLLDQGPKSGDDKYQLIYSVGVFGGRSITKFELNNDEKKPLLITMILNLKVGFAAELIDFGARGRFRVMYELNAINTMPLESNTEVNGEYSESRTKYVFGSDDYYHAITAGFDLLF